MLNEAGSLKLEEQIHVGWQSTYSPTLTCTLGLKAPVSALQFQQNNRPFCISRAPTAGVCPTRTHVWHWQFQTTKWQNL